MKNDLSRLPTDLLLEEIGRRLRPDASLDAPMRKSNGLPLPNARNSARQQIANSLSKGMRPGQTIEILRLLASADTPQTMPEVIAHMHGQGYRAKTFYDASNALAQVGFAERCYRGTEKAWRITQSGKNFLHAE